MISIDFRQIWVFSTPMFDSRWLHKKLGSVPWCERWEDGKIGYIAVKDAAGNDIVEPIKVGCRFGGKLFCQSASPYGEWQGETGSYFLTNSRRSRKGLFLQGLAMVGAFLQKWSLDYLSAPSEEIVQQKIGFWLVLQSRSTFCLELSNTCDSPSVLFHRNPSKSK